MFYELQCSHDFDPILSKFVKQIEKHCFCSEFQFLNKETLFWNIPNKEFFRFQEFYYINNSVPVFERQLWEKISGLLDTDGVFVIPAVIIYCGEQHYFNIAVPPRIRCLDFQGRISVRNVGRYQIFKSQKPDDATIFIAERLYQYLKDYPKLKIKGV